MSDLLEEFIKSKIKSEKIKSPLNEKYEKLCIEKGNDEIKKIMEDYNKAMKEAGDIIVF